MNKKQKKRLCIGVVLGLILVLMLLFLFGGGMEQVRKRILESRPISQYTLDQYQAMSNEDKEMLNRFKR